MKANFLFTILLFVAVFFINQTFESTVYTYEDYENEEDTLIRNISASEIANVDAKISNIAMEMFVAIIHRRFEYTNKKDKIRVWCSGSVVASRWVLTAARCLLREKDKSDRMWYPEERRVYSGPEPLKNGKRNFIQWTYKHPKYTYLRNEYNVGLIYLKKPLEKYEELFIIKTNGFDYYKNKTDHAVWLLGYARGNSTQKQVRLSGIESDYSKCNSPLSSGHFGCVWRHATGDALCDLQADEGGPVVVWHRNVTGGEYTLLQLGIMFQQHNCDTNDKVMFTRLDIHKDWILKYVNSAHSIVCFKLSNFYVCGFLIFYSSYCNFN